MNYIIVYHIVIGHKRSLAYLYVSSKILKCLFLKKNRLLLRLVEISKAFIKVDLLPIPIEWLREGPSKVVYIRTRS